jgi:dihydrofolate reductase
MVLSRDVRFAADGARVFTDPGAGLAAARALAFLSGAPEVCVIGGEEIYRIFLPFAGRILLSDVDAEAEADAFFTIPDPRQWIELSAVRVSRDADNEHDFIIRDLKRRASP